MRKKAFVFVVTILGIYLCFSLARGAWESYQNAGRLLETEQRLAQAKKVNQQLKEELAFKSTPYFVEKEARDKLGLAKSGETVIITPPPVQVEGEVKKSDFEGLSIQEEWLKVFFR